MRASHLRPATPEPSFDRRPDRRSPRRPASAVAGLAATALLVGLATANPASAGLPSPTGATSTSTAIVAPNATTALAGLSVTGSATLQVTLSTDLGTVSVPPNEGLALAYNNNWSGDPAVTFTGTASDINTALAAAQLTEDDAAGQTAHVALTVLPSQDGVVYSPPNQHFYEFVSDPGISWTDARTAASNMTLMGQAGYLATMPTPELNDFVTSKIENALNVWFGAESTDTAFSSPARTWSWVDGPLAGQAFTHCSNFLGGDTQDEACLHVDDEQNWSGWAYGEPNNAGGDLEMGNYSGEYVAVTNWGQANGLWNDLPPGWSDADGYVVEFGDQAIGTSDGFTGISTASSDVLVAGAPSTPTGVTATGGNGQAQLSFTTPAANGSPITGYTVNVYDGEGLVKSVPCAASGCNVTDLTNGTPYTFTVSATNELGTSDASDPTDAVTPATNPAAPTDVTAERGNASATVYFSAPAANGAPIVNYTVTSSPDGVTATCSDSPCTVEGLANGQEYTFVVHATNAVGDGADSDASNAVTPATVPDAPVVDSLDPENAFVKVFFHAGEADGGSPVLHYVVRVFDGEDEVASQECDGSPCTVEGLTNGTTYTATVEAVNDVGTSTASDHTSTFVPSTVPGAPANLAVTRGDGQLTLTFDPAADNGSSITSYQVSLDGGDSWNGLSVSGSGSLSALVGELANGTTYHVAVRAVNGRGPGPASTPVQDGTPATVPGAPTHVGAVRTGNSGEVAVSWQAPASDGGDAITSYDVLARVPGSDPIFTVCTATPCTISGLEDGVAYRFEVWATNTVGHGLASDVSDPATPATAPDAPRNLQVVSDNGSLLLTFDAPERDGGDAVTGYEVSTDSGVHWAPLTTNHGAHYTASVASLTNGTAYPVRVRAVNGVGAGSATDSVSGTPATVPGAPRSVKAHRDGTKAVVTWTAPVSDGGAPIGSYVVVASPGAVECVAKTGTSCTFAGLTLGKTYTFAVQADNTDEDLPATGIGAEGTSAPLLVEGKPGVPRHLSISGSDRRLLVSYLAPTDDGGTPITAYQVSLDGGRHWVSVSSRRLVGFGGVLNGATYRVTVRAVNRQGVGPATAVTSFTMPNWFHDPIAGSDRAHEVAVPAHPERYRGARRWTIATARAFDGTPALPVARLGGRQLQGGEAASLGSDALFDFDSAALTAEGKAAVRQLAKSLHYVRKLTCEGYSDFGGSSSHQKALSKARAQAVCSLLRARGVHGQLTVRGYGGRRPVVVGGTPSDRAANRRVIVLARG